MANLPSLFRPGSLWSRSENPFRELNRLQRQVDRMFEEMGGGWSEELPASRSWGFSPACDVQETDSHYLMSFDLPGVKKDDIHIDLVGNELRVSGERHEEHETKGTSRYQMERAHGSFTRTFTLPQGIRPEQIETDYRDGVLHVAVPKLESAKSHRIQIGEGRPGLFQRLLGGKKEEAGKAKPSEKSGEKVA